MTQCKAGRARVKPNFLSGCPIVAFEKTDDTSDHGVLLSARTHLKMANLIRRFLVLAGIPSLWLTVPGW